MPLDTGIYQNLLARPRSVQEHTNDYMQGAALQQNLLAQRAQMQDREQARQRQNALMAVYQSGLQGPELQNALMKQGALEPALKIGKDIRENAKLDAERDAKLMEARKVKYGAVRDLIQGSHLAYQDALQKTGNEQQARQLAEQAYQGGVQQLYSTGLLDDNDLKKAGSYDPLKAVAFLDRDKEMQLRLTQRGQDMTDRRTREEGAANRAVTMRGQNMTDARARDLNEVQRLGTTAKNETELRKEFDDLVEVKNYKKAYPAYANVKAAASRSTPQADINLVYGLAKLYDPDSVVREGEYATIANSQAIPEWLKGMAQRIAGGARLTDETRKQIMVEADSRIGAYGSEYEKAVGTYAGIASRRGMDPANVFQATGDFDIGGKRKQPKPTDDPLGLRRNDANDPLGLRKK